ncbi:MAG TPA: hypothetical protein PKW70_04125 [Candidatus Pacearchaeota archaeon]|jgi:bifunctional DNA-binding transcriptional regulator/antitoxin component of YhaV-PrlF toxin-antitoxin module|nr:hypothetical protein [Candidatus Pacearchaeota archaeon]
MRLQSQISREYKGEKYEKSWIVVPQSLLKELGWKSGQELKAEIKDKKLIIEKDLSKK